MASQGACRGRKSSDSHSAARKAEAEDGFKWEIPEGILLPLVYLYLVGVSLCVPGCPRTCYVARQASIYISTTPPHPQVSHLLEGKHCTTTPPNLPMTQEELGKHCQGRTSTKSTLSTVGGSPLMGWGTRQQNFHPGTKRTESWHDKAGFSATIVERWHR